MTNPYFDALDIRLTEVVVTRGFRTEALSRHANLCPLVKEQVTKGVHRFTKRRFTEQPAKRFPLLNKKCPFCQRQLATAQYKEMCDKPEEYGDWIEKEDMADEPREFFGALEYCMYCLYWRWHYLESLFYGGRDVTYIHNYKGLLSKVQEFSEPLPEGCSPELVQWLRRNETIWHTMNPYRLERLVADVFRANYLDAEVIHVGKPDDGGVDVLFIDAGGLRWLIQVKRRENPNMGEPVGTIRNLLGTMSLEESMYGIVVSTADHFTYQAHRDVNRADKQGKIIKLIDRGKLDRMLDPIMPDRPWIEPLRVNYPNIVSHLTSQLPRANDEQLKLFKRVPRLKSFTR